MDFVRTPGPEFVKTRSKAVPAFAGQAEDQVGVQVRLAVLHQPAHIGCSARAVLPSADAALHLRVQALDANLELQHPGGEAGDAVLQARGQLVGDEFEVHKQRRVRVPLQLIQKKFQDAHRRLDFQVEGAVHKFESARAACVQIVQRCQKFFQLKSPGGFVQGAQAKRALERAAARSLHVQNALG